MKNETISWIQIKNIAFVGTAIITAIIAFMRLTSKVDLLDQKMDILLTNQSVVMEKLVTKIEKFESEIREHDLTINEMKIKVGMK